MPSKAFTSCEALYAQNPHGMRATGRRSTSWMFADGSQSWKAAARLAQRLPRGAAWPCSRGNSGPRSWPGSSAASQRSWPCRSSWGR
jgi:hypothetical protein